MSTFRLLILLCFVALATSKELNGNEVEDRIHADWNEIDRMKADYGDRPFQVFVTTNSEGSLCGGALIEWNWVLTAAHCLNNIDRKLPSKKRGVVVKAGIIKRSGDPAEQRQKVRLDRRHIIYSPNWKLTKWDYGYVKDREGDLALLRLSKPFEAKGGKAGLVKIYERPIDTTLGRSIKLSGWGITNDFSEYDPKTGKVIKGKEDKRHTKDLLVSTVKHLKTEVQKRWNKNNEFLVLVDTEGNVSCGGDSGGPATIDGQLVGITTAGVGRCGHNGKLSLYTSVYKYLDWICKTVWEKDNIKGACERKSGGSGGGTGGGNNPIDGEWSSWGAYGECSKTCGGGKKTRTRSCSNPPPSNGGRDCEGSKSEKTSCSTRSCPRSCSNRYSNRYCDRKKGSCRWYSVYSNCKKTCGRC